MSVIDRRPISIDNDDEHHKNLMHRQGKNYPNNDASKIFVFISKGSTVVVQWEDGGPWTHGTIVGKGDHNHHNRSYKIPVTNTGRIITCNRQHIKPTPITALQKTTCVTKLVKHIRTDPCNAILDHIWKNPHTYTDKAISNERDDNENTHGEHGVRKQFTRQQRKTDRGNMLQYKGGQWTYKWRGKHCEDQIRKDCEEARQTHVPAIAHECLPGWHVGHCKKVKW